VRSSRNEEGGSASGSIATVAPSPIDWTRLVPDPRGSWRSFEGFCYQLVRLAYERFGSISYPPQAPGIEFYLELNSDCDLGRAGQLIGWQAKFFWPNPPSASVLRQQIAESFRTSLANFPSISKWVLCTPKKLSQSNSQWLIQLAANEGKSVDVVSWSEHDYIHLLARIGQDASGLRHLYFGTVDLTPNSFAEMVQDSLAAIKEKYIPEVHTPCGGDKAIHAVLGDSWLLNELADIRNTLGALELANRQATERLSSHKLSDKHPHTQLWSKHKPILMAKSQAIADSFTGRIQEVDQLTAALRCLDFAGAQNSAESLGEAKTTWAAFHEYNDAIAPLLEATQRRNAGEYDSEAAYLRQLSYGPLDAPVDFEELWSRVLDIAPFVGRSTLLILGEALTGKTHLLSEICAKRAEQRLPAVFLIGSDFKQGDDIAVRVAETLGLPTSWSWPEILGALDAAAVSSGCRLPIVIDGINESERPFEWKDRWAKLCSRLARFPNLSLIASCRETDADAIWGSRQNLPPPTSCLTRRWEDPSEMVERYFQYFNIDADVSFAPVWFFSNPLALRLFCETTNPSRQGKVHTSLSQATFLSVLDTFVRQVETRICSPGMLGKDVSAHPVLCRLESLGAELWQQNTRSLPQPRVKELFGDGCDAWPGTYIKELLDESLVLRRSLGDNQEYEVSFLYDRMAGYFIARQLAESHRSDVEGFLVSEEAKSRLFSQDYATLHPLHDDILFCLSLVLPTELGFHLWRLPNDRRAFDVGVRALFELIPGSVDVASVELVRRLFSRDQNRKSLFSLSQGAATVPEHPLNQTFWDGLLRDLAMADRDLSWTEFVRKERRQFLTHIKRFEEECRAVAGDQQAVHLLPEGTARRLELSARRLQWLLASTDRALRDHATRALYWYGRVFPLGFATLVVASLDIDDPYVWERMLAAQYGVAMALQFDDSASAFRDDALPVLAHGLYDTMFAPDARARTTHILARDYAWRTLDIARRVNPHLLNPRAWRAARPPFRSDDKTWLESTNCDRAIAHWSDGLMRMDFANYTLGSLVRGRAPYDDQHQDYVSMRRKICWRAYDLGWAEARFAQVDKEICSFDWDSRTERAKLERYGKKYGWVAFFEMAGVRKDMGLLNSDYWHPKERFHDADIDPSFPERPAPLVLLSRNWACEGPEALVEWLVAGPALDTTEMFSVQEMKRETGPWVLLHAFAEQKCPNREREIWAFVQGVLIEEHRIALLRDALESSEWPGNDAIHRPYDDTYTFAGEIPWAETCAPYWRDSRGTARRIRIRTQFEADTLRRRATHKRGWDIVLNGLTAREISPNCSVERVMEELNKRLQSSEQLTRDDLRLPPGCVFERLRLSHLRRRIRIPLEQPVHGYGWESYHSVTNNAGGAYFPAPALSEFLGLHGAPQTFDLFDPKGRRGSIYARQGDDEDSIYVSAVFLRRDLLDKYLDHTKQKLVWTVWGERSHHLRGHSREERLFDEVYGDYRNVHKRLVTLEDIEKAERNGSDRD